MPANNKKRARRNKVKRAHTYKQQIVDQIINGNGVKGFKLDNSGNVVLSYDAFKDVFHTKTDFQNYFKDILKSSVPLAKKVDRVTQSLKRFNPKANLEASAFNGSIATYELQHYSGQRYADFEKLFRELKPTVLKALATMKYRVEWNIRLKVQMRKNSSQGKPEYKDMDFKSTLKTTINRAEAIAEYAKLANEVREWLSDRTTKNGSGWVAVRVNGVFLDLIKNNPIKAKRYFPIPGHSNAKSGLINIKNDDNYCFLHSVVIAIEDKSINQNRPLSRKVLRELLEKIRLAGGNLDQFDSEEVDLDYSWYEDFFSRTLMIYEMILGDLDDEIYPIYNGKKDENGSFVYSSAPPIKLLKVVKVNEEDDSTEGHFCIIKNMSYLLTHQRPRKRVKGTHLKSAVYCDFCNLPFATEELLSEHHNNNCEFKTKLIMPEEGRRMLCNRNRMTTTPISIVGYADIESLVKPCNEAKGEKGIITSYQECCSTAFTLIDYEGKELAFHMHLGENAMVEFLSKLIEELDKVYESHIAKHEKMVMTRDDEDDFKRAGMCCICKQAGEWESWQMRNGKWRTRANTKVRHHSHDSGVFIGAAHSRCNLAERKLPTVAIFFHNFTGYDSHELLRTMREQFGEVDLIGNNSESVKSLLLKVNSKDSLDDDDGKAKAYTIKFIDSLAFKKDSLERLFTSMYNFDEEGAGQQGHGLVHNLRYTSNYLNKMCQDENPLESMLKKKLVLGKNAYPYEYFDSFIKFDMPIELLRPEDFLSSIREGAQRVVEKHAHVLNVCKAFGFTTFRPYHDLYLSLDVYNLADIFELYRKTCLESENCGMDPAHFFGIPSLAYAAALKQLDNEVELLANVDEYIRLRADGMRGGISCWSQYYCKANNELHPEYDPSKPKSYILDEDATSLYPDAARMYLPIGDYQWLNGINLEGDAMWREINHWIDLEHTVHERGCYFWVDIYLPIGVEEWSTKVPSEYRTAETAIRQFYDGDLHDYNNSYPILIEKKAIPTEWLSPRQQQIYEETGGHTPTVKLVCDLTPKTKYMIHYLTLRQAMECGWVPTKIHDIFHFKQGRPLKSFMDGCITQRAKAKNLEEKSLQKNMMNSAIGKTIEDVMSQSQYRLFTTYKSFRLVQRQKRLKPGLKILNDHDLVLAECHKMSTHLNKPILLGISIYDISKQRMTQLWYLLQQHFGKKIRMLGTDTDSMIFYVECEDWDKEMDVLNQKTMFPPNHPYAWVSRFSDDVHTQLKRNGVNPHIGIFDRGEKYLKSVPGWFKLDNDNVIETVSMRAKQYSMLLRDPRERWVSTQPGKWTLQKLENTDLCKAKGVPRGYVENKLTHQTYKDMVLGSGTKMNDAEFSCFRSLDHVVSTIKMSKVALKAVDDKRYSIDGIHTLAHGHHRINSNT